MKLAKPLAAATLAAAPVLAFASPAAAADTEDHDVVYHTVLLSEPEVECTLRGGIGFEYDEETDVSWVTGTTSITGASPRCWENTEGRLVTLTFRWQTTDGEDDSTFVFEEDSNHVDASTPVQGRVFRVDGAHQWRINAQILHGDTSTK